ncbi:reverse transcriptase domain-containing protein [Tanacetum coccineum]
MVRLLRHNCQFYGFRDEDANEHLNKYLSITQFMKQNGVSQDSISLNLFSFSLTHEAESSFYHLKTHFIHTWEEMILKFLSKYYPHSRALQLRKDILKFRQLPMESVFKAWKRFKSCLRKCPDHRIWLIDQIFTFYHGITMIDQDKIMVAAGGNIMRKTPQEAYDLIENMTQHHFQWDAEVYYDTTTGVSAHYSKTTSALSVQIKGSGVTCFWSSKRLQVRDVSFLSSFYYLGTRWRFLDSVQAWQEIVEKVKSRLSKWKSKTLSIGGRLTLLKSVLGSIPVFHMSIFPKQKMRRLGVDGSGTLLIRFELWNFGSRKLELICRMEGLGLFNSYGFQTQKDVRRSLVLHLVVIGKQIVYTIQSVQYQPRPGHPKTVYYLDSDESDEDEPSEVLDIQKPIHSLSDNPTPSSDSMVESLSPLHTPFGDNDSLLEETDTLLSHSDDSIPDYETFCFDIEEKSSGSTTSYSDLSVLDYKTFCFDIDHQEEKSSGNTTYHSDLSLLEYESFLFDLLIDPLPPTDRSDSHHEEFVDELAHIISSPGYDHFYFDLEDDPGELTSDDIK